MDPGRGERRLVTLLFADLVGSTQLSEDLDIEDYADMVVRYQRLATDAVEEHGGVVNGFAGDGLCAYFGFPESHADDALRAVESGLRLVERVSTELAADVRVGIHAGVTILTAAPSGDFDLFGQVANVASRVEGAAQINTVAVSGPVVELLDGAYELADARTPELKGVTEAVEIHTVVGSRTDAVARVDLVGRDAELALLRGAFAEDGAGRVHAIVGEAGAGKSALFRAAVDIARSQGIGVVQVAARDLDRTQPFRVLRRFLHALRDAEALPPLPPVLVEIDEGRAASVGGSGAVVAVIEAAMSVVAQLGRVVIAIEDLQWADPSSRAWLDRLARTPQTQGIVVLSTSREPVPFADLTVELETLDASATRALARSAGPSLDGATIDEIVDRAGGVPLFVVELARAAERGTDPVKVHSSLLGAFDQAGDSRPFARLAAAIGEAPDPDLLAALDRGSEDHLRVLVDVGVMERRGERCAFRHALIRDEIYGTLLRDDRRRIHGEIADQLLDRHAAPAVVAHHLYEAARFETAADQFVLAATDAAARGATTEAVLLASQGLDATSRADADRDRLDSLELRLTVILANARMAIDGYGADDLVALWRRCEELGAQVADHDEQSSGMNGLSLHAFFSGDLDRAAAEADRVLEFAAQNDNRLARVRGTCSLGLARLHQGRADEALGLFLEAADRYRRSDYESATYGFGTDHFVIALGSAGQCRWLLGDLVAAADDFTKALDHAEALGSHISVALAHINHVMTLLLNGEVDAADEPTRALAGVADRYDLAFYRGLAELFRGTIEAHEGESKGIDRIFGALGDLTAAGSSVGVPMATILICRALAAIGDRPGALQLADTTIDEAAGRGERMVEAELHLVAADLLDGPEQRARLGRADEVASELGLHWSRLRALERLDDLEPAPQRRAERRRLEALVTRRTISPSTDGTSP